MHIAGLVLGVIACLFALLPLFGPFIAVPAGTAGALLSANALSRARGRRTALFGLTFSAAALPIMVIRTISLW